MRSVLKLFTLLCLFFGLCWLTGECLDAGVVLDACRSEVCASGAGQPEKSLFATLDVESPKAEPATRSGVQLLFSLRVQRSAEQGYFASLRSCGELLSHRLTLLAHRQVFGLTHRSIHPLQPACAYYIYALRRILI